MRRKSRRKHQVVVSFWEMKNIAMLFVFYVSKHV